MKSLRELQAIKNKMKASVNTRDSVDGKMRILVGMATCGIAAGARPVLNAFTEELARREVTHAVVSLTGCIGICQYEPVVEIVEGDTKTTYVKMDAEKVQRVVSEHVIGKKPVMEFTIGALNDVTAE